MNKLKQLLKLEFKTGLTLLGKAMITMAAMILIAALLLLSFYGLLRQKDHRITVGIYTEDTSQLFAGMLQFAESVPALAELARVETCSQEEGLQGLRTGRFQMLIALPAHFMEDAEHMQDVSMTVYVPRDSLLASERILSLLHSVESLMVTTESAILASYQGMEYAAFPMSQYEMENGLTDLYVGMFLSRITLFDSRILSPYGESHPLPFYLITAMLSVVLFSGVPLFCLYNRETLQVEDLLCITKGSRLGLMLGKWFILSFMMLIPMLVCELFMAIIGGITGLFTLNIGVVDVSVLLSLGMGSLMQFYLICTENRQGRELLFVLLVLLVLVMSGCFGSSYFLPEGFRQVSGFLPGAFWQGSLLGSLTENLNMHSVLGMICYLIGSVGASAICTVRRRHVS